MGRVSQVQAFRRELDKLIPGFDPHGVKTWFRSGKGFQDADRKGESMGLIDTTRYGNAASISIYATVGNNDTAGYFYQVGTCAFRNIAATGALGTAIGGGECSTVTPSPGGKKCQGGRTPKCHGPPT